MTIKLTNRLLDAIARAAHPDDYHKLHSVMFKSDEIVACNGHMLVRVAMPIDVAKPFGISRVHLLAATAAQVRYWDEKLNTRGWHLDHDVHEESQASGFDREVIINVRGYDSGGSKVEEVDIEPIVGLHMRAPMRDVSDYPPIDSVTPTDKLGDRPTSGIGFDSRRMQLIYELADAGGWHYNGVIVDAWGDKCSPMLFRAGPMRVVLMPTRTGE